MLNRTKQGIKGCVNTQSFSGGAVFFASKELFTVCFYESQKHRNHIWQFKTVEHAMEFIEAWKNNCFDFENFISEQIELYLWFPLTVQENVTIPEITIKCFFSTQWIETPFQVNDLVNNTYKNFSFLEESVQFAIKKYDDFIEYEQKQVA
jgi:hypothetical protein